MACSAQTIQHGEEDQRHRQRHVQVGVDPTNQRTRNMLETTLGIGNPPADRADTGNETGPIGNRMKMKTVAKNQKVFITNS
ncbi:MAG: hypothetical protein WDN28_00635 [Chthoniobacter sp.]